jgi:hypothetical protein
MAPTFPLEIKARAQDVAFAWLEIMSQELVQPPKTDCAQLALLVQLAQEVPRLRLVWQDQPSQKQAKQFVLAVLPPVLPPPTRPECATQLWTDCAQLALQAQRVLEERP